MALQSTDPIADMLTRVRNATLAGKNEVRLPASKLKVTVAEQLKKAEEKNRLATLVAPVRTSWS